MLFALLIFFNFSCSIFNDERNSDFNEIKLNGKTSKLVIIIDSSDGSLSKAIVLQKTNYVNRAVFTLVNPDGNEQVKEWRKDGESCFLSFDIFKLGIHKLVIQEKDDDDNSYFSTNEINIKKFEVYNVYVTLGALLNVFVEKPELEININDLRENYTNIFTNFTSGGFYFSNCTKEGIIRVYSDEEKYFVEKMNGFISRSSVSYRIINFDVVPYYFDNSNVLINCTGKKYTNSMYLGELYINYFVE